MINDSKNEAEVATTISKENAVALSKQIKALATELGFSDCAICDVDLSDHEVHLLNWLKKDFHGEMQYMQRHGTKRSRPNELVPGTLSIISVRLDYFQEDVRDAQSVLDDHTLGYVSRYALGRDYHKLMRNKLQKMASFIETKVGRFGYRAFTDSAPVLEKALAQKAGLGWIGKHSNLLNQHNGSWFFLGELFTNLPLPVDQPQVTQHCGSCSACLQACPTDAIVAPYQVDARRCISYLTIELRGTIPVEFRKAMGNRIYGCDDCQLVCPFNKFSEPTKEADFSTRHNLDTSSLVSLFGWPEASFNERMAGSAIRRIGYESWLRNIAIALGNAPSSPDVINTLKNRLDHPSEIVREHVQWALLQHEEK